MKNRKNILVALTIVVLVALMLLSRHPFEMGILLGSTCLLRWQAGGIVFQKSYKNIAALLVLWVLGLLAYSFICPVWVLYPFLLLVNLTVFLFAPVTNAVTAEEIIRKQIKVKASEARDSAVSMENLMETEGMADLKETSFEMVSATARQKQEELIHLAKELKKSLEKRRQQKNRSVFLTGLLSFFAVVTHGMPVSSLLFVALLGEMVSIWGAILITLREETGEA